MAVPVSVLDEKLSELSLNEKPIGHSEEFPFLIDEKTINFIKNSKVIFINRGLPGSGKSTLSGKIANLYETTKICSADDFFLDAQGNYNFDINKRPLAHEKCQEKAKDSCSQSVSPVIIDNTNLMYWEIKHYLHLAKQYDYLVMIIEPRTSHKFDIHKLALYNKHGVSLEVLKTKLEQYQIILPYYFGWFLNLSDSTRLLDQAKSVFEKALVLFPDFKKEVTLKHKKSDYLNFHSGCLHCTSRFLGSHRHHKHKHNESSSEMDYAQSEVVSLNMGRTFELKITGFSLSDKTMAAIVELNELESKLWQNAPNDEELDQFFTENKSLKRADLEKLRHGSTAHVTLAKAADIRNKHSGVDLLKVNLLSISSDTSSVVKHEIDDKEFIYYGDCMCLIKLKSPLLVDALFTGDY